MCSCFLHCSEMQKKLRIRPFYSIVNIYNLKKKTTAKLLAGVRHKFHFATSLLITIAASPVSNVEIKCTFYMYLFTCFCILLYLTTHTEQCCKAWNTVSGHK